MKKRRATVAILAVLLGGWVVADLHSNDRLTHYCDDHGGRIYTAHDGGDVIAVKWADGKGANR